MNSRLGTSRQKLMSMGLVGLEAKRRAALSLRVDSVHHLLDAVLVVLVNKKR